ncbi:polysaccharide deacetylase family protein [Clostridium sporogenes]|uniref:Polysaccharide deacetylase n=1 Tax=Clostridium sporogenes TaxID=1509 RepID=A0ABX4KCW5_CLOSG|nr:MULTISPECIES: polysaccharide deacetylase family protein [Clostridium]STC73073.1 polysaccharide deacetylase family protein [Clostridium botulinum]MBE6055390.1 polysaccharide deacetylase [Clostridium sp.]MCW6084919.1 polysaccharide deacetylase [Clostridium sporogenes]MCW6125078.1 polysaccharide deacetylase [Clostridium sporogenes]MDU7251594.1 polysaccharide deacetylase family protein [Clostridium sp.]
MDKKNKILLITICALFFIAGFFVTKNIVDKKNKEQFMKKEMINDNSKMVIKQMDDKVVFSEYIKDKYDAKEVFKKDGKKIAFLTFDDGPSYLSNDILDILKKYNIKATFFVVGNLAKENKSIIERQIKEGHSIGNHTYTHNYKNIYSSVDVFVNEVDKTQNVIKSIVGSNYDIKLVRFPGGSFGDRLNTYKEAIKNKGYYNMDWNALNGDAEGNNIPKEKLIQNIKSTIEGKNHVVILMHDCAAKKTTVEALPDIIEYLISQGYEFKALK